MSKVAEASKICGKESNMTMDELIAEKLELKYQNQVHGASDDRVTKIAYINEAINEYDTKKREEAAEAERKEKIRQAKVELELLQYDRKYDKLSPETAKTIVWFTEGGYRRQTRYTTMRGFLKKYIQLLESNADIQRAD